MNDQSVVIFNYFQAHPTQGVFYSINTKLFVTMEDGHLVNILGFLRILFKLLFASNHFGDLIGLECLLNFFSLFLLSTEGVAKL